MKRIMMFVLLAVAVVGVSFAQQTDPQSKPQKPQLTEEQKAKLQERKEMLEIRMEIIKEELKMTDEQFEKFKPIYREYAKVKQFCLEKREKIDWEKATRAEINEAIKARLDNEINTARVRKNFILLFENAITARQVDKLYKVEGKLLKKAREEYNNRQSKQ